MKMIPTTLATLSALAAVTTAWCDDDSVSVKSGLVLSATADDQPLFPADPYPGYIVYSGYDGALPGPNCYWTGMPVYDAERNVVGWRGRPVAVCPRVRMSAQAGN